MDRIQKIVNTIFNVFEKFLSIFFIKKKQIIIYFHLKKFIESFF